jgi:hypothetical protein
VRESAVNITSTPKAEVSVIRIALRAIAVIALWATTIYVWSSVRVFKLSFLSGGILCMDLQFFYK